MGFLASQIEVHIFQQRNFHLQPFYLLVVVVVNIVQQVEIEQVVDIEQEDIHLQVVDIEQKDIHLQRVDIE